MAIIGKVERKNWKVKLLNISIHVILLLGAATMVYPLLIMISGSIKSDVDFFQFSLLPEYIYNKELLFKKYLQTKYNGRTAVMFNDFRLPVGTLINMPSPDRPSRERYSDYKQFLTAMRHSMPHYWRVIGMAYEGGVLPLTLRDFHAWLHRKYGEGSEGLAALNQAYNTEFDSWRSVKLSAEYFLDPRAETNYDNMVQTRDLLEFKNTQITNINTSWSDNDGKFVSMLRQAYFNNLSDLNKKLGTAYNTWSDIILPVEYPAENKAFAAVWHQFVRDDLNFAFLNVKPEATPYWHSYLRKKYRDDLVAVNRFYQASHTSFEAIPLPSVLPPAGQLRTDWNNFIINALPPRFLRLKTLADEYRQWLQKRYSSPDQLNEKYGLGYPNFEEVEMPETQISGNLRKAADWNDFADSLNAEDIGLSRNAIGKFRDFVLSQYTKNGKIDFKSLSIAFKKNILTPQEIPFYFSYPAGPDITNAVKDLYRQFVQNPAYSDSRVLVQSPRLLTAWKKFLKNKYKNDIRLLNRAWGMIYTDWNKIFPPTAEYEWFTMLDNRTALIKEYLKRNYLMVFDTILTNGFAAKNTVIYCLLAVMASLLVNPLCAYGLSRFKMAPAYKILLFLMLPMAFPGMVLGIPRFLLIKNLGLLNTFAALILPAMANGYSIFLLKGFFDSLPKELFESAALDGASEWTVFWHIAMGLSTPILSVLALNTFTAAYGNFMMAFLLCQDKSMWTMMVYLYQLQQNASQAVGFAALIIAAIPTLLVFIFCQNMIIKGIVVPTEK